MKTLFAAFAAVALLTGAAVAQTTDQRTLENYRTAERIANQHLKTFDTLDFDVFSNQDWGRLKESHAQNVTVHWPDGHATHGIDKHIDDLKYMFTYAPDTRIKVHPVKVAQGDWTAVVGVMEGTFTRPMTMPDGKVIQPNGKAFKIPMATVSHWNKEGTMSEEYLFWDNQTYMAQLGIAG
ncbi:MAG: polyketide cyclase [Porphyrobacter sp.]|nr:polyketide cyclase [Porphyrobacter sp.]